MRQIVSQDDKISKGKAQPKPLTEAEYKALAEFRYQIRRFLRHMEEHAREFGHNPQQYQVLLAIEGLPKEVKPIISTLAERMQLNHNSMVELIDRCEERGLIRRARSGADRRQVELAITNDGHNVLRRLAPRFRARCPAAWIAGPSAIGSENGMPISTRSAPAPASPWKRASEVSGSGSPAVR